MKVTDITPKRIKSKGGIERYLAECVSVVRDRQPKNAEKLLVRLLTESVGDKPSRVLEYVPCKLNAYTQYNDIVHPAEMLESAWTGDRHFNGQLFGFFDDGDYFTTARELLNMGWSLDEVIKVIDFTHYKVFRCETPYFIYGQVSTHNQLTTVSHSQRYAKTDRGFWMPPEIQGIGQKQWDLGVSEKWRPLELRERMKKNGITRKEVFDRGVDMLQNRTFTIGGFTNNPNAWGHFLEQRLDNHTQYETRMFTQKLDALMSDVM